MTDRDRLIELLCPAIADVINNRKGIVEVVDYLIENGVVVLDTKIISTKNRPLIQTVANMPLNDVLELVKAKQEERIIVPPCKVGAEIFGVFDNDDEQRKEIYEGKVLCFSLDENNLLWAKMKYKNGLTYWHTIDDLGKTVFLTKEEVEAKLKELINNAR